MYQALSSHFSSSSSPFRTSDGLAHARMLSSHPPSPCLCLVHSKQQTHNMAKLLLIVCLVAGMAASASAAHPTGLRFKALAPAAPSTGHIAVPVLATARNSQHCTEATTDVCCSALVLPFATNMKPRTPISLAWIVGGGRDGHQVMDGITKCQSAKGCRITIGTNGTDVHGPTVKCVSAVCPGATKADIKALSKQAKCDRLMLAPKSISPDSCKPMLNANDGKWAINWDSTSIHSLQHIVDTHSATALYVVTYISVFKARILIKDSV